MSGETPHPPDPAEQGPRALLWLPLLALALLLLWMGGWQRERVETISYSAFRSALGRGELSELVLEEGEIHGLRSAPRADSGAASEGSEPDPDASTHALAEPVAFRTVRVEDPDLLAALEQAGVSYRARRDSTLLVFLLSWILPLGVMILLLGWVLRAAGGRAGPQAMGFGKSRARLVPESGTGVTFADVAGCDEAKNDLVEMVEFLRNPGRFIALGARIPKGVLLLGPPGTGKTLLARAVAGEAEVPFFSISGSDFVEMFVGVGAARVRDLFVQAKKRAPCIVFVDEIDAVGRQRGVHLGIANDEREQTLNQLLAEMDGFEANSGVILLAATNRPEILDRALLRPGRFDRQVVLDAPDRAGREAILRVHARGKPIAPDVDLAAVARATPGMSGADLANALNEAALASARRGATTIDQHAIEEAVERVMAGPERRSRRLGAGEKRRVACHESGHALVAYHSERADPVQKISIVPRGRAALGYTLQLPEAEQFLKTAGELEERLGVLLAGRAAEALALGEVSTGAQDDLEAATALARQMVCRFGLSQRLGLASCARPSEGAFLPGSERSLQRDCSEETAREIDEEVKRLLDTAHERARSVLAARRPQLELLTEVLLDVETLDREAFERLLAEPPGTARPAPRVPDTRPAVP